MRRRSITSCGWRRRAKVAICRLVEVAWGCAVRFLICIGCTAVRCLQVRSAGSRSRREALPALLFPVGDVFSHISFRLRSHRDGPFPRVGNHFGDLGCGREYVVIFAELWHALVVSSFGQLLVLKNVVKTRTSLARNIFEVDGSPSHPRIGILAANLASTTASSLPAIRR